MKKSSRPMFLVIEDLTCILARTKRVATARTVDCIARKAEDELGLGEINERAGSWADGAMSFRRDKMRDNGSCMDLRLIPFSQNFNGML